MTPWIRLDHSDYDGPLVRVVVANPDRPDLPALAARALLDTGATHTVLDAAAAAALQLRGLDVHRTRVAGAGRAEGIVHAPVLSFPDHPFPSRRVRVSAMPLPSAFQLLLGMDLLRGARLALEWGDGARWLRWEPL
jgi:predicted aspartyl protease